MLRVIVLLLSLWGWSLPIAPAQPTTTNSSEAALLKIRAARHLPALATVVVKDGLICDRTAVGLRKIDDPSPITTQDLFHIGSCTKSMTATLVAMFVEQGTLRWDSTIAEIFPELRGQINAAYEPVTIEQLLQHRAGLSTRPPAAAWAALRTSRQPLPQQRRDFLRAVLQQKPEAAPGTKMIYSNQGYVVAGAMLEKLTGQSWEQLITEKLFRPLHLDTAGFGPPETVGQVSQPWGHLRNADGVHPSQEDNPPALGPAGTVHCSLDDLARFVIAHLDGENGGGILSSHTFKRLHTPPTGGDYAAGWGVARRTWAGGVALTHQGSNTFWFVVMWLAPKKHFAVIAATNIAGPEAERGCDEAVQAMIQQWLSAPRAF
ncbi:MAG TPA: serine hydrolase domain-containing protein [Verrucomicrobiota bacterium]|nr:serine hydrolase domain-containing protein [Verrucomicrobiota bacterium]HNT14777.1 serine hydrolase domain-containing protein [Verrucomicrobiota bacterium]